MYIYIYIYPHREIYIERERESYIDMSELSKDQPWQLSPFSPSPALGPLPQLPCLALVENRRCQRCRARVLVHLPRYRSRSSVITAAGEARTQGMCRVEHEGLHEWLLG